MMGFCLQKGVIRCDVPQGSVLGPLLLLLYVNYMHITASIGKVNLDADDTAIGMSGINKTDLENIMIHMLKGVQNWFNVNKLSLKTNPKL